MDVLLSLLVAIIALALSVGVGAPVTAGMLRLISRSDPSERSDLKAGNTAVEPPPRSGDREAQEVLRGGMWIGLLERFAVSGCILLGYPAGIAVVVAIKGLGRFSTLQDAPGAGVSERFLVGTLASYLWAALIALAALGVLQTIP